MKFLPTLDLWDAAIVTAVQNGQLKLLPGQWVRCGQQKPSRFCGVTDTGTIICTHPQGHPADNPTVSMDDFRSNLIYWKSRVGKASKEELAAERQRRDLLRQTN